jgi:hypothetical protein
VNGAAAPAAEPASPAPSTPKTTPDTTPTANTPTTARSGEPPPVAVLHVQASSDKALRRAVELCEDHLRNVGQDLAKWRRQPSSGNYSGGEAGGGNGGGGRRDGGKRTPGRLPSKSTTAPSASGRHNVSGSGGGGAAGGTADEFPSLPGSGTSSVSLGRLIAC